MKTYLILITGLIFLGSCGQKPKDFANITPGMTKEQVLANVGEPSKKNEVLWGDLWVYKDENRTVVFRKDTVYNIITSAEARIDSIENMIQETGRDVKNKLDATGDTIDSASLRIKNKIMGDSVKKN